MTRDQARTFVQTQAQTSSSPALTAAEVEACLDQSRIVDAAGRLVNELGYVETIWATRAVVLALDLRCTKAASKVDLSADGASINASQRFAQLKQQRASWRSRMVKGTS